MAPDRWLDSLIHLRCLTERFSAALPQLTLAKFIEDGHFARHVRRMREMYGTRLATFRTEVRRYLNGALSLAEIEAGLNVAGFLDNSIPASRVAKRAESQKLDLWTLDRFALDRKDLNGFLLGFAPFTEREIRGAIPRFARAIETALTS